MKKAKKKQNHSLSTEATLPTMATLVEVVLPAMDLLVGGGGESIEDVGWKTLQRKAMEAKLR